MKTNRGLSRNEFLSKFGTNEQCINFLIEQKWGQGFVCRKCKDTECRSGRTSKNKRCKSCGYEESPTSQTLFHKLKFDISKAFGMIYDLTICKKGSSSMSLADQYEVSQNTAWLFRMKVRAYMKGSKKNPLTGTIHVDEFEVGGPQEKQQGRSKSDEKSRFTIALEVLDNGCSGRMYVQTIEDFSAEELGKIFEKHIDQKAKIITDKWTGYIPLIEKFPNLIQKKSDRGRNFPEIHIQIRNIKTWIRGIHSWCSKQHIQSYMDENSYRFNRRNHRITMAQLFLNRAIGQKTLSMNELINSAN